MRKRDCRMEGSAEAVSRPRVLSRVVMMLFKPVLSLLMFSLGFLGVVVCRAGIAAVWSVGTRLARTNEKAFDKIDEALVARSRTRP